MRARKRFAALTAAILTALSGAALAQEYDAQQAKSWMAQFAQALLQFSPINDPAQTLDPARPGEYLQEYEFGTVQAATSGTPTAAQIEEIDVSTAQVTDARGVRVGMTLSEALGGLSIPQAEGNLAVVSTQETGVGWCWAYLGEGGVYGVEWLTYDLDEPVTEYTLTYDRRRYRQRYSRQGGGLHAGAGRSGAGDGAGDRGQAEARGRFDG